MGDIFARFEWARQIRDITMDGYYKQGFTEVQVEDL
jgi:hypothetical protein